MTQGTVAKRKKQNTFVRAIKKHKYLYLMLVPPILIYIVFRYAPLTGLQVAFKDYNIFKGMWQSPWAGLKYFKEVFSEGKFWMALKNTVLLNLWDLIFGFPIPILLAIMLYEMRSVVVKKITQTVMYLPHFLSWIIIGGLVVEMFGSSGMVNLMIKAITGSTVNFLTKEISWVIMYVAVGIWQSAGWGTIIYLAAISGVDTQLYEAAEVDGCGRIKRIIHVTIPCIMPTILVMLILQLGQMVGIGFERPYVMANDLVRNVADVTSTFVYQRGIVNSRYSFSTAVDIFGSVVNMMFLIAANTATKHMGEGGLW